MSQTCKAILAAAISLTMLAACSDAEHKPPEAASSPGGVSVDWPLHGLTAGEQRYSPLDSINATNVDQLGLAWSFDTQSVRGLEATPIVVDGRMYITSTWSRVFALDAKTGKQIWAYDPQVERAWAKRLCCDVVNRGVAVHDGKVYVGTLDGYLVALDADSGAVIWKTDTLTDRSASYSITGAPRVVAGRVVIGNGGAEFNVRGYISAYDADTGTLDWRFFTVPGSADGPFEHDELKAAAQTWDPDSTWGGGTAWDSMAYDPKLNLLYVGTGNGGPWSIADRSPAGGDNLYLASILALDPASGKLRWHYQTTPGENWDFTATQHMILADLTIAGQPRKVLMQAPKNGFFYVLDRQTGELISAENFVYVNWAERVDGQSGRPVLTGLGDYSQQERYVFPSPAGAHNWHPMSFSQRTGLVYIPARETGWVFNRAGDRWFEYGTDNIDELTAEQALPKIGGYLKAWDPVAQQLVWQLDTPNFWNGGVLSTAGGLVLHGTATGHFLALDDRSGDVLADLFTGSGIIAPPITYQIDGRQYISVLAGWGGPAFNTLRGDEALLQYANTGRVLTFALGGGPIPMPPTVPPRGEFPLPPPQTASAETVEQGRLAYVYNCAACHGIYGSTPMLSDLRRLSPQQHDLFDDVVLGGLMESRGMASFAGDLAVDDVAAIQAYVIDQAWAAYRSQSEG